VEREKNEEAEEGSWGRFKWKLDWWDIDIKMVVVVKWGRRCFDLLGFKAGNARCEVRWGDATTKLWDESMNYQSLQGPISSVHLQSQATRLEDNSTLNRTIALHIHIFYLYSLQTLSFLHLIYSCPTQNIF